MNDQKRQAGSNGEGQAAAPASPQHLKMLLKREICRIENDTPPAAAKERNALWLEQIGKSIEAAPHHLIPGADKATIVNISTNREEIIPVNPKLTALENAALYLKKSRKARKNEAGNDRESEEAARRLELLRDAYRRICTLTDTADASVVAEAVAAAAGALKTVLPELKFPDTEKPETIAASPPYRRVTIDGWDIFLGRTETDNDELSLRFAAPADLWFHAAGCAGSHCIIRRPKGAPPPPLKVIEAAASLAAWYSKARNAPRAEVHMTEARFVGKRRNAPAGEVTVQQWKSLKVVPRSADHQDFCT
jgi:predicted ribosome quality control (RQC) complex YloA/Tae2 family protein